MSPSEFYVKVECLCLLLGGSVTSGVRTSVRNQAVGGVSASRHMLENGRAVDVVLDDMGDESRDAFVEAAWLLGFDFVQDEGDHIHLQVNRA